MASKGYAYIYNGAWIFATADGPQRVGHLAVELHAADRA